MLLSGAINCWRLAVAYLERARVSEALEEVRRRWAWEPPASFEALEGTLLRSQLLGGFAAALGSAGLSFVLTCDLPLTRAMLIGTQFSISAVHTAGAYLRHSGESPSGALRLLKGKASEAQVRLASTQHPRSCQSG
eukprot:5960651-Amphidinium_carterae.1